MNIYITCTPEFSVDKLKEVIKILSSVPGEMSFNLLEPFSNEQASTFNEKFDNINKIESLTFDELFSYLKTIRLFSKIKKDDFLIIITSIANDKEWFSAFNDKDIFVHGAEWDLISNVDSKYGIAHQCVENIFQSLIHLDIVNYKSEPNIHEPSIGCINDFCEEKSEIILKLKSADICDSCYDRALKEGLSDNIIAHVLEIINKIREQFIFAKHFKRKIKPEKIVVDSTGVIKIGEQQIDMTDLPKTLYIHFLRNSEGIKKEELCGTVEEVEKIYSTLKLGDHDPVTIQRLCCTKLVDENSKVARFKSTFEKNRTLVKEAIRNNLGEMLSNIYAINIVEFDGKTNTFKINVSPENIQIAPAFLQDEDPR